MGWILIMIRIRIGRRRGLTGVMEKCWLSVTEVAKERRKGKGKYNGNIFRIVSRFLRNSY